MPRPHKKPAAPPRAKCPAIAKSGKPCPHHAVSAEQPYCNNHDPAQAARRREAGAVRHHQPLDPTGQSAAPALPTRPRTKQGVIDTALDHLARVRAGEPLAIATAQPTAALLKVALDGFRALEEPKSRQRGASSQPASPPDPSSPVSNTGGLIGEMVAEHHRSKSGSSVQ